MPAPHADAVAATRRRLVITAHRDLSCALAAAVPFVVCHPEESSVLDELGVIAEASEEDLAVFRAVVGELVRAQLDERPAA